MYKLKEIKIFNFRNYKKLEFQPNKGVSVFYGKNGSGKTNLLEAVHFCCFGRSQRTRHDKDMMMRGEVYTSAQVKTERITGKHDIELKLRHAGKVIKTAYVYGKKVSKISEMMGHSTCVLFAPEDMQIIKDGPQDRRRFMDMQISQMRYRYLNQLSDYVKCMKYRNIALKNAYVTGKNMDKELDVWEEQMCINGADVIRQRQWFLEYLNSVAAPIYADLSKNTKEKFTLEYSGIFKTDDTPYLSLEKYLKQNRDVDTRRGVTTQGPHKDEIEFKLNTRPMKEYASQGQIRTAVLSLKLAMIEIITHEMGDKPILLLDDVFSELDPSRRKALLDYVKDIQTFVSCTDISDVQNANVDEFYHVESGTILRS